MPTTTARTQEILARLLKLQKTQRFCFHGSSKNIEGFLKPHQAHGKELHERHLALYASTDIRPAIVRAILSLAGESGDSTWGWSETEDVYLINGSNMQFIPGYIYVLDRGNFGASGSGCGTEIISRKAQTFIEKIQVEPELLENHEGILIGPSLM